MWTDPKTKTSLLAGVSWKGLNFIVKISQLPSFFVFVPQCLYNEERNGQNDKKHHTVFSQQVRLVLQNT